MPYLFIISIFLLFSPILNKALNFLRSTTDLKEGRCMSHNVALTLRLLLIREVTLLPKCLPPIFFFFFSGLRNFLSIILQK